MWMRKLPPEGWRAKLAQAPQVADLGSQLEDLMTHVLRCERWARFDDRLDLAWSVQRKNQLRRPGRR
jgi:hypothetical protein